MEVDKIMRALLTLGFCPLPCLRGVLEFAPSVSNVLIILSTSMSSWSPRVAPSVSNALIILSDMEVDKIMGTLLTLGANSSTPRRHGSGQNNEYITNTRGKLEHSTKTWKWTK
jgi:hypothetical protein